MRFVGYVKSGGRDPQDRVMGVVIDDKVAPLASIDAFYEDLSGWRQRAAGLSEGEIPLADLTLAPPVPRDANLPKPVRAMGIRACCRWSPHTGPGRRTAWSRLGSRTGCHRGRYDHRC